jgi:hypothetical protein
MSGEVQRLVIVISGTDTGETLERWVFNVQNERPALLERNRYIRMLAVFC